MVDPDAWMYGVSRQIGSTFAQEVSAVAAGHSQSWKLASRMMFSLLLLLCVCVLPLDAQLGFISIDCGSTSNYTDNKTSISWSTDEGYITHGYKGETFYNAQSNGTEDNLRQLQTVRYFPQVQSKYCYVLYPVINDSTYLIRATLLYPTSVLGTLSQLYSFKLAVDATIWITVTVNNDLTTTPQFHESVYLSVSDELSVCIIPDGKGTPFISALELRLLNYEMYPQVRQNTILNRVSRINCGATFGDPNIRYPDDIYDRIWYTPSASISGIAKASTNASIAVDSGSSMSIALASASAFDYPPEKVMQSAWEIENLAVVIDYNENSFYFYVAMYFYDFLPRQNESDVRGVSITVNDQYWYEMNLTTTTVEVFDINQFDNVSKVAFAFFKPEGATLVPLVNGLEFYSNLEIQSTTSVADVDSLSEIQNVLNLEEWTGDPCNPVPWDWVTCSSSTPPRVIQIKLSNYSTGGYIPTSIALLDQLTDLWLDGNNLTGSIIPSLGNLGILQTLYLQNNDLSGTIPGTLAGISGLRELNVANNNLSGIVPGDLQNDNKLTLTFTGNPFLCSTGNNCTAVFSPGVLSPARQPVATSPSSSKKGSSNIYAVVGGAAGGAAGMVVALGFLCYLCFRMKKNKSGATNQQASTENAKIRASSGSSGKKSPESYHPKHARSFSLDEVKAATDNFKAKIGQGGFGPVYYGKLPTGEEVAVKVKSDNSNQGATEFFNEVELLSRVHHKNLVSLIGYCDDDNHQILIYDYMSKGTLRSQLYGVDAQRPLDWKTRLDVALNSARGIEYLHNDCSPRIIHRDVKSNNILLNQNMLGKVADFGISRGAADGDISGVSTVVRGTPGYLDPEYFTAHKLTNKSDVYSFGVVLLEIICGRMPYDSRVGSLVEWARMCLRDGNIDAMVDPFLQGTYNVEAMWKIAELAMFSVEPRGMNRPDMSQVVRSITEAIELETAQTVQIVSPDASTEILSQYAPSGTGIRSDKSSAAWRADVDQPEPR